MHRETKKAPGVPGLFKVLKVSRGPNDSLDAAILSGGTNQARRGSRKRLTRLLMRRELARCRSSSETTG